MELLCSTEEEMEVARNKVVIIFFLNLGYSYALISCPF